MSFNYAAFFQSKTFFYLALAAGIIAGYFIINWIENKAEKNEGEIP